MLFTSPVFLFIFLPMVLFFYYISPTKTEKYLVDNRQFILLCLGGVECNLGAVDDDTDKLFIGNSSWQISKSLVVGNGHSN